MIGGRCSGRQGFTIAVRQTFWETFDPRWVRLLVEMREGEEIEGERGRERERERERERQRERERER